MLVLCVAEKEELKVDGPKETSGSLAVNSAPRVIIIPPSDPVRARRMRVADYARVSSNLEDQFNSFLLTDGIDAAVVERHSALGANSGSGGQNGDSDGRCGGAGERHLPGIDLIFEICGCEREHGASSAVLPFIGSVNQSNSDGKGKTMNTRKSTDYSVMYRKLDQLMEIEMP